MEQFKKIKQRIMDSTSGSQYFDDARSWANDMYATVHASRNRYKLALIASGVVIALLVTCITTLVPLQHLEPIIINHYSDGATSVEAMPKHYRPTSQAQEESDIVRYMVNREGYDFTSYDRNYRLIGLMSAGGVFSKYASMQSTANKHSPINDLGNKYYRTVHVDNILPVDQISQNTKRHHNHHNLAEVTYSITDHSLATGNTDTRSYKALIGWVYRGMPTDPNERWQNWNGFTVTKYQNSQINTKG